MARVLLVAGMPTAIVQSFFTKTIQTDPRYQSPKRLSPRNLLEPATLAAVDAIMKDAAAAGIPLMLYETFRSKERQQELFKKGATKLKTVGVHHYGLACDLVKDVNGEPSWKGDFTFLGKLARRHGLIWGGDWGKPGVKPKFFDGVHVQRITVARQASLFAGTWYPDSNYSPWA